MPISEGLALGIGAGASLLQGLGNIFGVNKSNAQNLKIARQTNALNYQMFKDNQAFQEKMWNAQNAYNDPSAQKARLRAAGFSPYLLAGTPQMSGVSSSLPNGGMQSAVTGAAMQPLPYGDLASVAQNAALFAAAKKDLASAKNTEVQTQNFERLTDAQIDLMVAQGYMSRSEGDKMKQEQEFMDANWNTMSKQLESNLYETYERGQIAKIQRELLQEYGKQEWDAKVSKLVNEATLLFLQGETEKAEKKLIEIQGDATKAHAITERLVGESTAAANYASVDLQKQLSAYQKMVNSVYSIFGKKEESVQFLQYLETLRGMKYENAKKEIEAYIAKRTKHSALAGQHLRNITGWLPFMTVPIAAGASHFPAQSPKPVAGFK